MGTITMLSNPENKSNYEMGDKIKFKCSTTELMVVGAGDLYIHTFTNKGQYYGVFKLNTDNLANIVRA